jgi:hypothetical protein
MTEQESEQSSDVEQRAKAAADSETNAAERDRNQRRGVDEDQPAGNPETER